MTDFIEVETVDLSGPALDWARRQPDGDQPETFGCNHSAPTCPLCKEMVIRWLVTELGDVVSIPVELLP